MKRAIVVFVATVIVVCLASSVLAQDKKIEEAKKERQLLAYGSTQAPQMNKVLEKFRAKYPFLEVEYFRSGSEKLFQRFITEARAGSHLADAIIFRQALLLEARDEGLLAAYESLERKFIEDTHKDKEGFWTGVYSNLQWLGYNSTLVSPGEVPKRREELLHPKWKGKMGLDPTADHEWFMSELHIMGEQKGLEYMRKLAKQEIQFRRGHSLLANLLVAGEFPLILTLRDSNTFDFLKRGAPIGWVAFDPLVPLPAQALGIAKKAPHPNAARLFADFVLSREAQEILKSMGRNSTRVDVEPRPEERHIKFGKIDWSFYLRSYDKYARMFNEIFGLP